MSFEKKIIVVTGANSGIGKETAKALALKRATIILVCRDEAKGYAAQQDLIAISGNQNIDLMLCDFSRHQSIKAFSEDFYKKYDHLDVLVNNAGLVLSEKQITPDGFEWMFGVNHLGYFLTTHYLLPALKKAKKARIVNVASMAHRFSGFDIHNLNAEKNFSQFGTYGLSKLCNILFTRYLAKELEKTNITVNSLHPGTIASNFAISGSFFYSFFTAKVSKYVLKTTAQGAATSIFLASSDAVEGITGEHFSDCKKVIPSMAARSEKNASDLWIKSMELTGIKEYGII